jgi:hypothetical protein
MSAKKEPTYRYASILQNKSVEDFGNVNMIVEKAGKL